MLIEYKKEKDKPVIYIFKYVDGKRIKEKITDFEPYFYVLKDEPIPSSSQIVRVEEGDFKSLYGEKLKKIIVKLPEDVPTIRTKFKKTFEADIVFTERFLIDRVKQTPYEKLRVQYLDIENDDSLDTDFTPKPITVIGTYDSFLKKYVVFCWRQDLSVEVIKEEDISYYKFNNEIDMIKNYVSFLQSTDPDIITGWNVEHFDMTYIINRMTKLNLDNKLLSPIKEVSVHRDVVVKGRIIFNMFDGYEYLKDTEVESRRLDDVGRTELNLEKLKFEGTAGQLWRTDFDKLIRYNKRDIEILIRLDDKMKILSFVDELRRMGNCNFKSSLHSSMMFDNFLLTQMNGKVIFETRKRNKDEGKIEGAIVVTPVKKLHNNIVNIDLKSLYPSIIISLNMSPETLKNDGEYEVGNGVRFTNKFEGIIPQLEKYLWRKRDEKKAEKAKEQDENMKQVLDRQQYCIKVCMNAIYGQTSFLNSRIYCTKIAESITFIGRKILTATIDKLKQDGFEIIYGDTDGIFLKVKEDTNVVELVKGVNEFYNEFCKQFHVTNQVFDIQLDKTFKSFIICAKKRYAGIDDKGKFVVKGLETRRTDNSKYIRKLQKEILMMILNAKSKSEIKKYLNEELNKFKTCSLEDIGIPRSMKSDEYKTTSPWLRGCEYSKKNLGIRIVKGDKIKLLYIKKMPEKYKQTSELCFFSNHEIPEGTEIDYEKMMEKGVIKKLERIFEIVGWDISEMMGVNKSLFEF